MDSILDISDWIGEDYEAAEINFFDLIPWTPDYVASLGEDWIVDIGSPDPDHARSLVTIMVYIAEEATAVLCEALSFNVNNMNVDKILARQHVQPEPVTAEITTEGYEANQDNEAASPFCSPPLLLLRSYLPSALPLFILHFITLSSVHTFLYCTHCPHFTTLLSPPPSSPALFFALKLPFFAALSRLTDIPKAYLLPYDAASDLRITPEHRRRFAIKLFDSWSTSHGTNEIPESPTKKTKEHSRIPVSVWSQDLPASGAAKRKRDDDDDDKTPSPKKQKAARKKGAKAFVSVTKTVGKGDDKITFDYRDGKSLLTTAEFLDFDPSVNLAVAKAQSLIRHDAIEVTRSRTFNEQLIITTARNWIVEAARLGLEPGSDLDLNPMGEPQPVSGAIRTYRLLLMYH
ncbi:uncharacterized protein FIESC28_04225 [Fusarium coffeatum]|uniref:Uncharacterized protein n=1 Tax=Fusarium coffeatum TaxID=231269 RepID=A0A366S0S3_9HYPO|nr:uncharacterized protein FIESC28_04225 [Fusarium coffeatum]RBR22927.1 hypothetical protein FIESC28_04225 [Fusarium coffeatum]